MRIRRLVCTFAVFLGALRYDPIEDLIGCRAERNSASVEVVLPLKQNAASVALAE